VHFCSTLILAGFAVTAWAESPETAQRYASVVRPDSRTGKLVRSMVLSSKPVPEQRVLPAAVQSRTGSAAFQAETDPAPPMGINEAVARIAAEHSLPAQLIHSVIKVESNYNPYAVSSKGALGMMQLIPETARRFGVKNVFNPEENIQGGAKYLRYLLDLFAGSYPLALAAYNAGEAAVARYGGIPPYPETKNYVLLVRRQLELAKKAEAKAPPGVAETPKPAVDAKPDGPAHIVEEVLPDGSVRYVTK
jgi:soluble lytic murein transglycosylase-like protein